MRPRGFVLGMLLGLLVVVVALAQVTPAGKFVRTYPPTGDDTLAGGAGPLPNQAILPPGSVSYWPMNEAAGVRVDPVAGNDLTPTGTITQITGKVGFGVRSTSANPASKLENATTAGLNPAGSYTFAAWVRLIAPTVVGDNGFVLYDVVGAQNLLYFRRNFVGAPANRVWGIEHRDAGGVKTVYTDYTALTIVDGTWFLFIATYDSAAGTLTIKAANEGQTWPKSSVTLAAVGNVVTPAGAVRFTITEAAFGSIWEFDEVGMWHRVLSPAEEQNVFAGVTL